MCTAEEKYDMETAAAWILGHARRTGIPVLPDRLQQKTAVECSRAERRQIVDAGLAAGLKLYPFKNSTQTLARTQRTLGFLRSISFESMLDVGSGRGVFLIPFIKAFPGVRVTALDLAEKRIEFLNELADGGFRQLKAVRADIRDRCFPDDSFDVVCMLEVLEHIPEVERAVESAVRTARRFVVVTVPSKPDSNPEHIHLLTKEKLTRMFTDAGCGRLHFDGVEGHLFMVAAVGKQEETNPAGERL